MENLLMFAAIDYSMTSPSVCVYDETKPLLFENCHFYVYSDTKRKVLLPNVNITKQLKYDCTQDRFDKISNWALEILQANQVKMVGLEGYSYGSKSSRLFEIGENGGLLKHKLWLNNINFNLYSPREVKKSFTGKGNAKKELMSEKLKTSEGIDMGENPESPVSDIVDSYAILRRLMETLSV
jgi:Holliday junction resolvasome RuvABC endonuclease subunit